MTKEELSAWLAMFAREIGKINPKVGSGIMAMAGAVLDGTEVDLARTILEWVGKRQIQLGQKERGKEALSVARSKDN